ncbi:ATP-binding protein [Bradyrhizobium sp. CCBAU 45384]|uniref:ATP-binding protein n=1 Tax=Bradyrhizobium sp. CCBAU 45384 TaxID=858428 RepID=UPI00230699C7|nr:ATP-binding protein [Bradyrhizobium sp. CCBAU 45384]MDA9408905.1 ATPase [Bradyrhizobium sp. CCBAU 45384]
MPLDPKHLIELTDAALAADYTRVRRVAGNLARELAKAGDEGAAKELRALIRKRGVPLRASGYVETLPVDSKSRLPLVEEQPWPANPLFLNEEGNRVFRDFLTDTQHIDELNAKGLASRLNLLLSGPPGTGKSLLAGHIAASLGRPFYVVRLDSVITSLLGDTGKNIRSVFDFVPSKNAVLFLDEMDAIAKLRDDKNELGELKRVVNTVIQGLDSLDPHAVVIAATNHAHLLDPAIWRRFPYKIEFGPPEVEVRADLWKHFLFEDQDGEQIADPLSVLSEGLSGADIETISLTARRHALLDRRDLDFGAVALAILNFRAGGSSMPQRTPLGPEQKKHLALGLKEKVSAANIARLLGVTRQAIYQYFKQED